MESLIQLVLLLSTIPAVMPRTSRDILWTYWGKKGESYWDKEFDKCRGRMQSPIDINTEKLVVDRDMKLDFINYDIAIENAQMVNTGYKGGSYPGIDMKGNRVELIADLNDTDILITGTALHNITYRWTELHFHWNDGPNNGSEHAIDGKKFAMECHIVHQNVNYNDTDSANDHENGYAIIGLFYVETDQPNQMYDMITEHLHNVQDIGQEYTFDTNIYLKSLLPPDSDLFYRYHGSYTTPGCNEAVTWIIYPEPVFIDKKQMKLFRTLYTTTFDIRTGHLKRMVGNIRHLQPIGDRSVYTSNGVEKHLNISLIIAIFIKILNKLLSR